MHACCHTMAHKGIAALLTILAHICCMRFASLAAAPHEHDQLASGPLLDGHVALWMREFDADGDGQITQEEFHQGKSCTSLRNAWMVL